MRALAGRGLGQKSPEWPVRQQLVSLRAPWWVAVVYSPMDKLHSPETRVPRADTFLGDVLIQTEDGCQTAGMKRAGRQRWQKQLPAANIKKELCPSKEEEEGESPEPGASAPLQGHNLPFSIEGHLCSSSFKVRRLKE